MATSDYEEEEDLFGEEDDPPPLPPPLIERDIIAGLHQRATNRDDEEERERQNDKENNNESSREESAAIKKVRKPLLTLKVDRLFNESGIPYLTREFPKLKFKGKGHEKSDLKYLLKQYEHWANRVYPKYTFKDFIKRVETLGSKSKEFKTQFRNMRYRSAGILVPGEGMMEEEEREEEQEREINDSTLFDDTQPVNLTQANTNNTTALQSTNNNDVTNSSIHTTDGITDDIVPNEVSNDVPNNEGLPNNDGLRNSDLPTSLQSTSATNEMLNDVPNDLWDIVEEDDPYNDIDQELLNDL